MFNATRFCTARGAALGIACMVLAGMPAGGQEPTRISDQYRAVMLEEIFRLAQIGLAIDAVPGKSLIEYKGPVTSCGPKVPPKMEAGLDPKTLELAFAALRTFNDDLRAGRKTQFTQGKGRCDPVR